MKRNKIERAYAELSECLFYTAPVHKVSEEAPQSYKTLKQGRESDVVVWRGGSSNTIYGHKEINWAFRAIHDTDHLALDAPFDHSSECLVAKKSIEDAQRAGVSPAALLALYFDSFGQNRYYELTKKFLKDQRAFVTHCMEGV